ncbi:hypothetical protein WJX72_000451 [[Myrmecia] bisecta]|uniref:Uncharacterized protein n=1 Tax=[Myrmecia] bisecta TaxID=41462 RepID=A0AAW1PGE7_9CHLO
MDDGEVKAAAQLRSSAVGSVLDRMVRLLARICHVPIAVITLDLSNQRCILFTSNPNIKSSQDGKRLQMFDTWLSTVPLEPELLIIQDTLLDARSRDSPWVTGEYGVEMRAYGGCPLVTSKGCRIGALQLADWIPRKGSGTCAMLACNFADIAVWEVENDRKLARQTEAGC